MSRIEVEVDDAVLAEAMALLGTETPDGTVNEALRTVAAYQLRRHAMAQLRQMAADGAIDMEHLSDKRNYRS
ncbi:type II toxin-antitoxin system VapB family antitoxin [Yinghuangia soli]|uniref:Type II toxin-antitoxin system VapB family antitoxin n=1 Tax=Yinghuangia soli TaxID=2908204 RepID=A0AA41PYM6_9ACTN|nr:type II toxin-antitoxin system VapB family antitoxin [Yinghuangia soli]MCF2528334.1 type II toxin-antitoxin system VapB family antitoxin [Yinghuangia soli]